MRPEDDGRVSDSKPALTREKTKNGIDIVVFINATTTTSSTCARVYDDDDSPRVFFLRVRARARSFDDNPPVGFDDGFVVNIA